MCLCVIHSRLHSHQFNGKLTSFTSSEQETLNRLSLHFCLLPRLLCSCPPKPYLLSTSCLNKEKQWPLRIEAVLTQCECVSRVMGQVLGEMQREKGSSWACHAIMWSQCIRAHCALWLLMDCVCDHTLYMIMRSDVDQSFAIVKITLISPRRVVQY